MRPDKTPVARDIVLIGGGHSHAVALHSFAMRPEPGVRITLICTDSHTPYSGMLPGYVAGLYGFDDVHIDLRRLAQFAGARFLRVQATGIDRTNRQVICLGRPPVPYDVVSVNIGSAPSMAGVSGAAEHAIPVKPIQQFNLRWLDLLDRVRGPERSALHISVVGAGAGGVELLLAMQYRLTRELQALGRDAAALHFHLISASPAILPKHNAWVRRRFSDALALRGVQVHLDARVVGVKDSALICADGRHIPEHETIWVTQAAGAPWLADTGLALDPGGFLRVNDNLQSISDTRVFAAGDIAAMDHFPLEKAGVFAVRMGRPLAANLRHAIHGRPLVRYVPQRKWLALVSTGDRHAVASRGAFGAAGKWVWYWKDWIDRRFMQQFTALAEMQTAPLPSIPAIGLQPAEAQQSREAALMRCGGCAAKVPSDVLSRALAGLQVVQGKGVALGLDAPDDAAVVHVPAGKAIVQTVDFFRSMVDDPWMFGQIAANHALGDIFAMGAEPWTATAIAIVPAGVDAQTEALLRQMMQGAVRVLNTVGCSLVGGHSGEGNELALGFAISGLTNDDLRGLTRKAGARPGDALILSKPLGTGVVLAAHDQLRARGRWVDAALQSMVESSQAAAQVLRDHGATACTDVTGFGLVGHLQEMARASGVRACINLSALPALEGATELLAQGIASSLQPANRRNGEGALDDAGLSTHLAYALLFDPQTAGGLLASVPAEQADDCVAALVRAGYGHAGVIGEFGGLDAGRATVSLRS